MRFGTPANFTKDAKDKGLLYDGNRDVPSIIQWLSVQTKGYAHLDCHTPHIASPNFHNRAINHRRPYAQMAFCAAVTNPEGSHVSGSHNPVLSQTMVKVQVGSE